MPVYLDTADWSYLCDRTYAEQSRTVRDQLAALGAAGSAAYLVSWDHLIEAAGLEGGLRDRVDFLRGFPGTVLFPIESDRLLRLSAISLASMVVGGGPVSPFPVACTAFSSFDCEEVVALVRAFASLKAGLAASALANWVSRSADRRKDKGQRRSERAYIQAFVRADWPRVERFLRRKRPRVGRAGLAISRLMMDATSRFVHFAAERGLATPPGVGFDPTFNAVVLASLPRELRRDASLVGRLFVIWRNPPLFARSAPSLACAAGLIDAVRQNPQWPLSASDEMDCRHCVYAPTVRVFTADKRNAGPLDLVLSRSGAPTKVVRTNHLHLVVSAIRDQLEGSTVASGP